VFQRISDVVPDGTRDELLRLVRTRRDWVTIHWLDDANFQGVIHLRTPIARAVRNGNDALAMYSLSVWLADGPKVFRPSPLQAEALSQVELRLALADYEQPFQAVLVDLPPGFGPFLSVLVAKVHGVLVCSLFSEGNRDDVVTVVSTKGTLEAAVNSVEPGISAEATAHAVAALRVAVNSCLALANYPHTVEFLYPKEAERDARLAKEPTERGRRAASRVHPQLATLDREVKLHRCEGRTGSEPTGREVASHWRRGHWAMVACGEGRSQRRRVFRASVLVRADKAVGASTTVYRS